MCDTISKRCSFLLAAAVLLLAGGCGQPTGQTASPPNVDSRPPEKASSQSEATQPQKLGQSDPVKITAEGLAKELISDGKAADAKYKEKRLTIEGKVGEANRVLMGDKFYLDGGKEKPTDVLPFRIDCWPKEGFKDKVGWLGKGQEVRVVGDYAGWSQGEVALLNCEFTELGSNPTPTVSAVQLSEAFMKDEKAADAKYQREVIVEGEVANLTVKDGFHRVDLGGKDDAVVQCTVSEDDFSRLKKGDKVTIKGDLMDYFPDAKRVIVNTAFILKK